MDDFERQTGIPKDARFPGDDAPAYLAGDRPRVGRLRALYLVAVALLLSLVSRGGRS